MTAQAIQVSYDFVRGARGQLTVAIIATQMLGDLVNAFRGDVVRGGIGFVIAGTLLVYLMRPVVRSSFASRDAPIVR